MNVDLSKLSPGTFGVSHGSGMAGEIIRHATGSWAGHAFMYVGNGMLVEGQPPKARMIPAGAYGDALWAWRMWDQLAAGGWAPQAIPAGQHTTADRARTLVGTGYDWPAYLAFSLEILHLRNEEQLAGFYGHDPMRVCSGLVADALDEAGVPLAFVPEDGPGLIANPAAKVTVMPPNLVAPGMLLGLAQRSEWL